MSEAKDWAGELISGQTGTGRILVSFFMSHYEMFDAYYDELRMDFDTEHYVYKAHQVGRFYNFASEKIIL